MTDRRKMIQVCETCGSPHISVDACATWDVDNQRWEINNLYDHADCDSCGGEPYVEELPLDTPEGYAAAEIASWDCDTTLAWAPLSEYYQD